MDTLRPCPAKTFAAGLENFQTGSTIKCKVRNLIEIPREFFYIMAGMSKYRCRWTKQLVVLRKIPPNTNPYHTTRLQKYHCPNA